jgi:hypothetical protein
VIYPKDAMMHINNKTLHTESKISVTDGNIGKTYPEASPEGPTLELLRELAGLLIISNFSPQGHASRTPQSLENLRPFTGIPNQTITKTIKTHKSVCNRGLLAPVYASKTQKTRPHMPHTAFTCVASSIRIPTQKLRYPTANMHSPLSLPDSHFPE